MAKKILLADDSITIQKVVELTFSDGDYEIVAVNNGSKAIQKLQEWRPDIILSDIIMPEKNGYEVCEFVKSHPDFKTIPVILLTGTFEPFDPDRAERAGCDAVVTKPFESQGLIHKVEELVAQSAPAEPPAVAAVPPSPFDDTHSERRTAPAPAAPDEEPFTEAPLPSPAEIFGAAEIPPAVVDRGGSVFDETNPPRPAPEAPAAPLFAEQPPPPAGEAPLFSAETTAFPKMSFADLQRMRDDAGAPPEPEPPVAEPPTEPAAPMFSAETTAFPKMSFDELERMRDEAPGAPLEPPAPAPLEWPRAQQPEQSFSAAPDTALGSSSFGFESEEPKVIPFEPPPPTSFTAPEPEPEREPEPEPVYSAETTAFPKMSFDDLQRMRDESAAPKPPAVEELPWTSAPEPLIGGAPEAPAAEPEGIPFAPPMPEAAPVAPAERTGALADEEVDRIARRVVELLSDKAIRDIAWEVIPDLAQAIVRERIRELETEG